MGKDLFLPALAFTLVGPVQLVGIARYADEVDWANPQMWGHLVFFARAAAGG